MQETASNKDADTQVYVDAEEETVCCRGTSKALGHPAVFLTFDGGNSVQCYYCGRVFKKHP